MSSAKATSALSLPSSTIPSPGFQVYYGDRRDLEPGKLATCFDHGQQGVGGFPCG